MFDYKYRQGDKAVAITTQFFLSPFCINQFQIMYNNAKNNDNVNNKIKVVQDWAQKEIPAVLEYHQVNKTGDLLLLSKYADSYKLSEDSDERRLLVKAKELGIIWKK
jgi:hypothetical protein